LFQAKDSNIDAVGVADVPGLRIQTGKTVEVRWGCGEFMDSGLTKFVGRVGHGAAVEAIAASRVEVVALEQEKLQAVRRPSPCGLQT
jgi:hypothetical protein